LKGVKAESGFAAVSQLGDLEGRVQRQLGCFL
jgi:hypothetical protein